jgi:anti-sigma regulatory factor (Ser/Thr protein kinase)
MSLSTAIHEQAWSIVVPHHARGAHVARHRLAAELRGQLPVAVLADTISVVAELVGNAVRHAEPLTGGVIRVAWRIAPADGGVFVEVRVTDGGSARTPVARVVGPDALDGRGLAIVAALARRWGVEREGPGHCVWAELGVPRRAKLSRREQA